MRRFPKTDKVSDLLRHAISNALIFEVQEEKLRWISITDVRVSRDIKIADVFYTVIETQVSKDDAAKLIEKNLAGLKRYLAHNLRLRQLPSLRFKFDDVEEKAQEIEALLAQISKGKKDGE
jgi:ribosome-binding factor A